MHLKPIIYGIIIFFKKYHLNDSYITTFYKFYAISLRKTEFCASLLSNEIEKIKLWIPISNKIGHFWYHTT